MAIAKKLITSLKNKTWTNPQIKNHKISHELRLYQTTDMTQNPKHTQLNSEHN